MHFFSVSLGVTTVQFLTTELNILISYHLKALHHPNMDSEKKQSPSKKGLFCSILNHEFFRFV